MVSEPIAAFCVMVVLSPIFASFKVIVALYANLSAILSFTFLYDFNMLFII